MHESAKN